MLLIPSAGKLHKTTKVISQPVRNEITKLAKNIPINTIKTPIF